MALLHLLCHKSLRVAVGGASCEILSQFLSVVLVAHSLSTEQLRHDCHTRAYGCARKGLRYRAHCVAALTCVGWRPDLCLCSSNAAAVECMGRNFPGKRVLLSSCLSKCSRLYSCFALTALRNLFVPSIPGAAGVDASRKWQKAA